MAEKSSDAPPDPGDRPWEQPWDTEQMRKAASDWSLAGDAGLLLHLQSFSQQLLAKTHDMQKKLNEVNREAKMTGVRMNNVLSDFIMLANKQFVENRVYDEDVSVVTEASQPSSEAQKEKTQEQREAELIPKITEAITMGLNVIDTAYEKIDIDKSNMANNDLDTHQRSDHVFAPKDPYDSRALPYLIGSVGFMHEENLGLPYSITEDEEKPPEVDKDTVSESSSSEEDNDSKQPESHVQTKQHNVGEWAGSASETESEGDLFESYKDKDEDEAEDILKEDAPSQQPDDSGEEESKDAEEDKPSNFMDELANKLRGPSDQSSEKKEKTKSKQRTNKDVPQSGDDIFKDVQNQAAEVEGDEDDFLQGSGRFTSKGGLFDDDEEEGDLFSVPAKPTSAKKEVPKSTKQTEKPQPRSEPTRGKSSNKASDLFGGSDTDEDDIFAAAAKSSTKSSSSKSKGGGGGGSLFGDDSASGSEEKQEIPPRKVVKKDSPQKKVPKGALPVFGAGNPLISALKKRQDDTPADESNTDTEDDRRSNHPDTDTSSSGNTDLTTAITKAPPGRKKQGIQVLPTPTENKRGGLFDEDGDEDLFSSSASATNSRPSSASSKSREPPQGGAAGIGLFSDDDLFSATVSSKINPSSKTVKKEPATKSGASLFGADNEDDLFSSSVSSARKKEVAKPKKQVLSLFDENSEEEDDIFAIAPRGGSTKSSSQLTKQEKSEPKPEAKSRVFKDEDVLFGSNEEEPPVDLFGANSPLSSPTKAEPTKSSHVVDAQATTDPQGGSTTEPALQPQGGSTAKKAQSGLSIFDDDEEEDLFATKDIPVNSKKHKSPPPSVEPSETPSYKQNDGHSGLKEGNGTKPKVVKTNSTTKKSPSLFDHDDDDEDLFASIPAKPTQAPISSTTKSPKPKPPSKQRPTEKPSEKQPVRDPFLSEEPPSRAPLPVMRPTDKKQTAGKESSEKFNEKSEVQDHKEGQGQSKVTKTESTAVPKPSDDEDDLFSSDEADTTQVAPPKPRPAAAMGLPTGAVSMFGGMDPASVLGRKFKPPQGDSDEGSASASAAGPNMDASVSAILNANFDQPAQAPTLHSATKTRAKIASKRRPPTRRGRPAGGATGDSEKPAPSGYNKHPVLASDDDVSDFFKDNTDFSLHNGHEEAVSDRTPSNLGSHISDPKLPSSNGEIQDIFGDKSTKSDVFNGIEKSESETSRGISEQNSAIEGDIFGTTGAVSHEPKKKDNSVRPKEITKVFDDDDIFADSHVTKPKKKHSQSSKALIKEVKNTGSDLFGENPESSQQKADAKVSNKPKSNDLDIFGDVSVPSGKVTVEKNKHKTVQGDGDFDIFADAGDDIFAESSSKSVKAPAKSANPVISTPTPSNSGAGSDEDIFSESLPKSKSSRSVVSDDNLFDKPPSKQQQPVTSSSKAKPKPAVQSGDFDIFGEPSNKDEDIFTSGSSGGSSSKASKQSKPNADLFGDDTDIFADLPPAKSKPTKSKNSTKSKPSIFSDDIDDIFATPKSNTSVSRSKPKAQTSKSKVKGKPVIDDIFGDSSPNIFDDPLSATKG